MGWYESRHLTRARKTAKKTEGLCRVLTRADGPTSARRRAGAHTESVPAATTIDAKAVFGKKLDRRGTLLLQLQAANGEPWRKGLSDLLIEIRAHFGWAQKTAPLFQGFRHSRRFPSKRGSTLASNWPHTQKRAGS